MFISLDANIGSLKSTTLQEFKKEGDGRMLVSTIPGMLPGIMKKETNGQTDG